MQRPVSASLIAEGLGTAMLLATVVGSGIMADKLAVGNVALALLANSIATGAILVVLILVFGPLSGAHFNPAVTIAMAWRTEFDRSLVVPYCVVQIAGAVAGVWIAHAMFDQSILQVSTSLRSGWGLWIAEAMATFGLLLAIVGCTAGAPHAVPFAIGLYIVAAYWFTASTSFANPAVTMARALSDTFAGIAPQNVPAFITAQLIGAGIASLVCIRLWPAKAQPPARS